MTRAAAAAARGHVVTLCCAVMRGPWPQRGKPEPPVMLYSKLGDAAADAWCWEVCRRVLHGGLAV